MRLDDGALTGSVAAMQQAAEDTWKHQVYRNPDRRPVDGNRVRAKYGPALRSRACPHVLAPLTGEDLAATITQWPRAKKGGTDAWEAGHFKDLPMPMLPLLQWRAEPWNLVEEGAPWPEARN